MRHELKFLTTIEQAKEIFSECTNYCVPDKHGDENGCYEVASLYYDSDNLRFFWDREESVGNRRKVRLRSYNFNNESRGLFLEIKERHKALVEKKRVVLKNCGDLDLHRKLNVSAVLEKELEECSVTREIQYLSNLLKLRPVTIIKYLRQTLVGTFNPDLRITFDRSISVGGTHLVKRDRFNERYLLAPSLGILEVKFDKSLPLWVHGILKEFDLTQTRFSKYCLGVAALEIVKGKGLPAPRSFAPSEMMEEGSEEKKVMER
jgi:SPX domain protein involved in polyphosphate accumulation